MDQHLIKRVEAFLRPYLPDQLQTELVEAWSLRERRHKFTRELAKLLNQTVDIVDGIMVIRVNEEEIPAII